MLKSSTFLPNGPGEQGYLFSSMQLYRENMEIEHNLPVRKGTSPDNQYLHEATRKCLL